MVRDIHFDVSVSVIFTTVWIVAVGLVAILAGIFGYSTMARALVQFLAFYAVAMPVVWVAVQAWGQSKRTYLATISIGQFVCRIACFLVATWVPAALLIAGLWALLVRR